MVFRKLYFFNFFYFSDKTITAPITGHITNLSPIKHKISTDRKYFDFRLLTEEKSEQTVCFSPGNNKLLKVIKDEKSSREIKRYKRTERTDILINDFTSIKKLKLDFTQPVHKAVFQEISTVKNELSLFDIVNVKEILYNIRVLETTTKDDKIFEFKKASLKDNTVSMPIALYNKLTKQITEGKCYETLEVRIYKCKTQRLLKTTKFTKILEI